MYQVTVGIVFTNLFADDLLHAIHIKGRQELSVGHGFNTILIAAHTNKFFYMRVPGRYIIIANRPGNAIAKTLGIGKLIFAPALAGPPPGKRFAAYLVAPDPVEGFFLYIGMVFIFDEK